VTGRDDAPDEGGWFDYEGWRVGAGSGRAGQFASAHESHHKQLSDSTIWGVLTRVLLRLPNGRSRAAWFNRAGASAQEAFATWAPAAALGWDVEQLAVDFPDYLRHWQAMDRAVSAAADAPYLALHAAHATARSCLQAPVLDVVLDAGLANCTIADVPRRLRPDHRVAILQRAPVDWPAVLTELDDAVTEQRWPALRDAPVLTAALFTEDLQPVWAAVNDVVYAACARQLAAHGCPTLPNDGHRLEIAQLLEAARPLGGTLDLAVRSDVPVSGTLVALANAEAETYISGPRLPARLVPTSVPASELATGPISEHLMLDIRRGATIARAFDYGPGPAPDPDRLAVHLRRGEAHDDGMRVVLRPADDLTAADLDACSAPTYAMADLSVFTADTRRRWEHLLAPQHAALILDLPLAGHLPVWLADEASAFRYAFLRTEVQGRGVAFLLADVAVDGAPSHLLVRGLSHAAVGVHRAAFEELNASGLSLIADDTVAERHEPLLGLVVAHLAIEERVYGLA
jgi:hypothetical protein